ncbi:MAG: hypothetical protein ACRD96_25275, partial [Bryobacteraceae bacterium]
MSFSLRWPARVARILWPGWLGVAAWLTVPPLVWHFEYARNSHPRMFPAFASGLFAVTCVAPFLYQRLRRRAWRWEPAVLAAIGLVAALAYEPLATLAVAWILAVSYGWGRLARERLALEIESPAADLGLSIATGLGLLVCVLFVAGLAGGLRAVALAALLAAGSAVARRQIAALPATLRAM